MELLLFSPDEMLLMRRRFVALRVTAASGRPSSLPSVSSVVLGEDDESDSRTDWLVAAPFLREIVDDACVQPLCGR